MKPFWKLIIPRGGIWGDLLDDTILHSKERVPEKMKDYWLMIPVALIDFNVTALNEADEDEDVTYNLKPTARYEYERGKPPRSSHRD